MLSANDFFVCFFRKTLYINSEQKEMDRMKDLPISKATRMNWSRLQTSADARLTKRANKRLSAKQVVPVEYFRKRRNIGKVLALAGIITGKNLRWADALYTIGIRLLRRAGIENKQNVQQVLAQYPLRFLPELAEIELPAGETDLPGALYQCLLLEGHKNVKGSYYTPRAIAGTLLKNIRLKSGMRFLDPCCGSGALLLQVQCDDPTALCGMDNDPLAVMLAKFNLLLKYPECDFIPDIRSGDFLQCQMNEKFDFIVTNPPWGAVCSGKSKENIIRSGESFSLFFVKAFEMLKASGVSRFLFPEAVLDVKKHQDLRKFMLEKCRLEKIICFSGRFSGVTCNCVGIFCRNCPPGRVIRMKSAAGEKTVSLKLLLSDPLVSFIPRAAEDTELVKYIFSRKKYDLSESLWAIGIVTGNNREKLFSASAPGFEPIYTGREVRAYTLLPCCKFILYDRKAFQQAAPEAYYRAPEKLVYKFISEKLVFAYDDSGALFLNSANILIPRIPGMSIKTVLAFLNSDVFAYLRKMSSAGVKVLKGELTGLPFPTISAEENRILENLVDDILVGEDAAEVLNEHIFRIFALTPEQIARIRQA